MSNTTFGTGNVISPSASNSLAEGANNRINAGGQNHVGGISNTINSGSQNYTYGANDFCEGFESNVNGTGNQTFPTRAGQNISGFSGQFMYRPDLPFAFDTFNYSNQLSGGNENGMFQGEGISMVDRTIANGNYPLGQHQAYLNSSDGINYAIMLKGTCDLKIGTFVTIGCETKCCDRHTGNNDRLLVKARC